MSEVVISAERLGKKYVIGHQAEAKPYLTLRETVMERSAALLRRSKGRLLGRPAVGGRTYEEIWAIRDNSFSISQGELVGDRRPERSRQEHAAKGSFTHYRANDRSGAGARPGRDAAGGRYRISPGAAGGGTTSF